ncbi:hypothetical protein OK074_7881 [Actinobacteria bacterium OK074]|nr:hypothetical protein OK074_7881 [Actinobacteria bacterium OK074]
MSKDEIEYEIRSGDREAFIAGLRELAEFLAANPEVLVPRYPVLGVIVNAADDTARRAGVHLVAALLGAPVEDLGQGFYSANRQFGPVAYRVTAVPPREGQL